MTRNAFIGSSRYEGSNPSVSARKPLTLDSFKGFSFFMTIDCDTSARDTANLDGMETKRLLC